MFYRFKKACFLRWHQIILRFELQSVILRFDNQLDREIELSLSAIRKVNSINIAFLEMSNRENQMESFFKVMNNSTNIIEIFYNQFETSIDLFRKK